MSILRRISPVLLAAALAACGESESSKRIGAQPKQALDKVTNDLNTNLQQGAKRAREAEEKK